MTPLKPKHQRLKYALILLFTLGSALFFALMLLRHEVMFFVGPDALWAHPETWNGRSQRLGGHIRPGSLAQLPTGGVRFTLQDTIHTLDVEFDGILPALFREGQSAIVEGTFDPVRALFHATSVLAKHDERYQPADHAGMGQGT